MCPYWFVVSPIQLQECIIVVNQFFNVADGLYKGLLQKSGKYNRLRLDKQLRRNG